jgi:hypothetical protein
LVSAVACTRLGWAPRPCENGSQPWRIASGASRLQRDRPGLWSSSSAVRDDRDRRPSRAEE